MYSKSKIMKRAWDFWRNGRNGGWCACTCPSISKCMKMSWEIEKENVALEAATGSMKKSLSAILGDPASLDFDVKSRKIIAKEREKVNAAIAMSRAGEISEEELSAVSIHHKEVVRAVKELRASRGENPGWMYTLGAIPEDA